MADALGIGTSALLSIQRSIATTSHNIANVNTEGYSRQSTELAARPGQFSSAGVIGSGVDVISVQRSYDQFLGSQVRDYTSSQSQYQTFHGLTLQINNSLADSQNGLSSTLQGFFGSLQDVSGSPSKLPERQVLIGDANLLVDQQQQFNRLLDDLSRGVNSNLEDIVGEVNGLSSNIAKLNEEIILSSGQGQTPNDLLDQRDVLLNQLAEKVDISVTEQGNGAVNVFIGNGQGLVIGSTVTELATVQNEFDGSRLEITIAGAPGNPNISSFLTGGEIQGVLDFRDKVLEPTRDQLGLLTLGLTDTFNAQHQLGVDLNGNAGGDFFTPTTVSARNSSNNTGTAVPTITIDDVGAVRPEDYQLEYDGTEWTLTRTSDGFSESGAGPLMLDGITVDVSTGTPSAGDSFLINPARDAASTFGIEITDPRQIAIAAPVVSEVPLGNTGTANIDDVVVTGSTSGLPITLTFNPDALGPGAPGYDVTGGPGGTIPYDPTTQSGGLPESLGGIAFILSGEPQAGDELILADNANGVGDNRNGLLLADLQNQSVLQGGTSTFQQVYSGIVGDIGTQTRRAEANLAVENSLLFDAQNNLSSVSSVNLDEEAANLLQLQQAYQAASRLISVSDEMFQALINSV